MEFEFMLYRSDCTSGNSSLPLRPKALLLSLQDYFVYLMKWPMFMAGLLDAS